MMAKPFEVHLGASADLRTSYAQVRAGFVSMALEKNRRATPHVDQARQLKTAASKAKAPAELLRMKNIRSGLLTASGVSDKAANHLREEDKDEAISGLITNFLEPAADQFVEELVFRFLLIRGDTLGGSMRNVAGALAQRKLTRSIISCLRLAGRPYWWQHSDTKEWATNPDEDVDVEISVRALSWDFGNGPRTLIYNQTVKFIRNNIDLCLMSCSHEELSNELRNAPEAYLALGELKGGIDPAGADEHWKTARTAIDRIQKGFGDHVPLVFFIGAAIENKMADEIWEMLQDGSLDNAANLTDDDQISSITQWLCAL